MKVRGEVLVPDVFELKEYGNIVYKSVERATFKSCDEALVSKIFTILEKNEPYYTVPELLTALVKKIHHYWFYVFISMLYVRQGERKGDVNLAFKGKLLQLTFFKMCYSDIYNYCYCKNTQ